MRLVNVSLRSCALGFEGAYWVDFGVWVIAVWGECSSYIGWREFLVDLYSWTRKGVLLYPVIYIISIHMLSDAVCLMVRPGSPQQHCIAAIRVWVFSYPYDLYVHLGPPKKPAKSSYPERSSGPQGLCWPPCPWLNAHEEVKQNKIGLTFIALMTCYTNNFPLFSSRYPRTGVIVQYPQGSGV